MNTLMLIEKLLAMVMAKTRIIILSIMAIDCIIDLFLGKFAGEDSENHEAKRLNFKENKFFRNIFLLFFLGIGRKLSMCRFASAV